MFIGAKMFIKKHNFLNTFIRSFSHLFCIGLIFCLSIKVSRLSSRTKIRRFQNTEFFFENESVHELVRLSKIFYPAFGQRTSFLVVSDETRGIFLTLLFALLNTTFRDNMFEQYAICICKNVNDTFPPSHKELMVLAAEFSSVLYSTWWCHFDSIILLITCPSSISHSHREFSNLIFSIQQILQSKKFVN